MHRRAKHTFQLIVLALTAVLVGCGEEEQFPPRDNTDEVTAFFKRYNETNRKKTEAGLKELEGELARADLSDLERQEKEAKLKKLRARAKYPEMFTFATPEDLPDDIEWVSNWEAPEIGSDKAKKGGVFNYFFEGLTYPQTLRIVGPKANNYFRSEHYDYVEMGCVGIHPNTNELIPSLAKEWAVSKDKQTVYFRIDEKATYSDGVAVESDDFLMTFYVQLCQYVSNPYGKQYYRDQFLNITRFDAKTFSVTLSTPKPLAPYYASLTPSPRHYYKEVGPDFEIRYDWRIRPTTGAYTILPGDIVKGRSITMSRVKDWWAKDRRYTKNTCNVDKIVYTLLRDPNKAFEFFKKGRIDYMPLGKPKWWYEKSEFDAVFNGYVVKTTFYNQYPRVPRGLYINCSRPLLDNRNIRIGLQYATDFKKICDYDYRGDAVRLNTYSDGYGRYSNKTIKAREFSVEKAAGYFAKEGFTRRDEKGVLVNDKGQKLSFTITYTRSPFVTGLMTRLKEEAIKAGVEYKLDGQDGSASFSKTQEKKHEICFAGWGVMPPFPRHYQGFHSYNAYEKGSKTPKPNTNNISVYADPEMDVLSQGVRDATTLEEIETKCHRIEEIIHRDAPWIPGYYVPFVRCGYWRWVQWPDDFNVKQIRDLYSSYVFWIDEDMKKETLKARRVGKTFPEQNLIFDQYRE